MFREDEKKKAMNMKRQSMEEGEKIKKIKAKKEDSWRSIMVEMGLMSPSSIHAFGTNSHIWNIFTRYRTLELCSAMHAIVYASARLRPLAKTPWPLAMQTWLELSILDTSVASSCEPNPASTTCIGPMKWRPSLSIGSITFSSIKERATAKGE